MARAFPTSTNATKHVLLALGSDCTAMDDVEIIQDGGQSACSRRFSHMKPHETKVQRYKFILRCQLGEVLVRLNYSCEV